VLPTYAFVLFLLNNLREKYIPLISKTTKKEITVPIPSTIKGIVIEASIIKILVF
jgi:hypothetical protein